MLRLTLSLFALLLLANSIAFAAKPEVDRELPDVPTVTVNRESVLAYVMNCRKANGAFGPMDQEYTDAAWNFPAVLILDILGRPLTKNEKSAVLANGLGYPAGHAGASHWLFYHQSLLQAFLDAPIEELPKEVQLVYQPKSDAFSYYGHPLGRDQDLLFKLNAQEFLKQTRAAEKLTYYNICSLHLTLWSLESRLQKPVDTKEAIAFVKKRQAPNGGFVDLRTDDAKPENNATHLATTFYALNCLELLNEKIPNAAQCAKFVESCQGKSGAFRAKPDATLPGNREDVYYTSCGLNCLKSLAVKPKRANDCKKWLNSLQNLDGGFGDQPGWRSRLYSTFYAIDSLGILSEDKGIEITEKKLPAVPIQAIPEGKLQIYQGLNKVPVCTPQDLPDLLERKLNLLGLKSDKFELAAELQSACKAEKLPMDAVLCLEAYPHRTVREADLTLHHVANIQLDPRWNEQQMEVWQKADAAGREGLPWRAYQEQVLKPLQEQGCLIYPEQDFEMDLAYMAYDAGLDGDDGYKAVLAGFNWAPRDFVRVFPWRERYVDKLTPVADCDAHGDLAKWSPQLDHCRHLYIATGPSYAEYLEAARAGRVVCAILDAPDTPAVVTFYGPPAAVQYVKQHQDEWQWWPEQEKE